MKDIKTSPFMTVEMRGYAFDVTALAERNQLLDPTARWEFDVLPRLSGTQKLQLSVAMRIPQPDRDDERISVPVLEQSIHVSVDPAYRIKQFIRKNWQWLVATIAGLGAAIAASVKLFGSGGD
jgi:hypothetical protein